MLNMSQTRRSSLDQDHNHMNWCLAGAFPNGRVHDAIRFQTKVSKALYRPRVDNFITEKKVNQMEAEENIFLAKEKVVRLFSAYTLEKCNRQNRYKKHVLNYLLSVYAMQ